MKILLPVDRSEVSSRVVAEIAQRVHWLPEGHLTLLHVVDMDRLAYRMIPDFQLEMVSEKAREAGAALLENAAAMLRKAGLKAETRLETGAPREVIPHIANDEKFALLVLGRRGTGEVRDVLFGSVTNHALHRVHCPVLLF
jgi:nucleotide-binding universal stress UspA family protein